MDEAGTSFNSCPYMQRFHHFLLVDPPLKPVLGIGIDTIRTLYHMRDCQGDQGFFTGAEFAFLEHFVIVVEEFFSQFLAPLAYISKFSKV